MRNAFAHPQANAVSDRVLDLRKCEFDGADLSTKVLSGALMSEASFKGANMKEVVMSKARVSVPSWYHSV